MEREPNKTDPSCIHCGEPIKPHELMQVWKSMHAECALRVVVGSVAHIEGRCSCAVDGSADTDPEGMTLREAAYAAAKAFAIKANAVDKSSEL